MRLLKSKLKCLQKFINVIKLLCVVKADEETCHTLMRFVSGKRNVFVRSYQNHVNTTCGAELTNVFEN